MMENVQTQIINYLKEENYTLATAESCTGGLLVARLIDVPGASYVINESYVTYSIDAKCQILGVDKAIIDKFGVASLETSLAMAKGLKNLTGADVCISTTGLAGGSITEKAPAICYYTIMIGEKTYSYITEIEATRNEARNSFCDTIYQTLLAIIKREV